jgi:hypothetical protein
MRHSVLSFIIEMNDNVPKNSAYLSAYDKRRLVVMYGIFYNIPIKPDKDLKK